LSVRVMTGVVVTSVVLIAERLLVVVNLVGSR
jgi:hypothetical protein